MILITNQAKLRVAIIGGGMGGLLLGLFFKKYAKDVHFDIYESSAELTEVGAGIGMSPRVWEILRELGLEDELLTITGTKDPLGFPILFRKGDEGKIVEITQITQLHTFQRSVLQHLFAKHLDAGGRMHFSKRLASYSEPSPTEPITLHFRDGTTATCDLVIGSDGIRSAVRRTMFNGLADDATRRGQADEASRLRSMVEPFWSRQIAYRGLVATSDLPEDLVEYALTPQVRFGKHKDIVTFPVSGGKFVNVVGVVYYPGEGTVYDGPWVESTTAEAILKVFEGWDPKALAVIKCLKEPFCWAMHGARMLPTFVKGRAAIIGDAAHGMLPHQGAGAGLAFEDGFILATIISHPSVTLANLPAALAIYDDVRRPFTQAVWRGSDRQGATYQLRRAGWEDVSAEESKAGRYPREKLAVLGEEVQKTMRWAFDTSILDETAGVVQRVEALSA